MTEKKIIVNQKEDKEVPAEVIAQSIVDIAKGMKKLNSTRLKRESLVTLIVWKSKICRRDIEIVLNHLEALEILFLKKK